MTPQEIIVGQLYTNDDVDANFGSGIVYLGCGAANGGEHDNKFLIIIRSHLDNNYRAAVGVRVQDSTERFWKKFRKYEQPKPILNESASLREQVEGLRNALHFQSVARDTAERELLAIETDSAQSIAYLQAVVERKDEAIRWCLQMIPSPCCCVDFSDPPHVCIAHNALALTTDPRADHREQPPEVDSTGLCEEEKTYDRLTADPKGEEKWLPIETAPKDGTRILLWRDTEAIVGYWGPINWPRDSGMMVENSEMWRMHWENYGIGTPSHWMPIIPPALTQQPNSAQ